MLVGCLRFTPLPGRGPPSDARARRRDTRALRDVPSGRRADVISRVVISFLTCMAHGLTLTLFGRAPPSRAHTRVVQRSSSCETESIMSCGARASRSRLISLSLSLSDSLTRPLSYLCSRPGWHTASSPGARRFRSTQHAPSSARRGLRTGEARRGNAGQGEASRSAVRWQGQTPKFGHA